MKFKKKIDQFIINKQGVGTIELLLWSPMFIFITVVLVEALQFQRMKTKVNRMAHSLAAIYRDDQKFTAQDAYRLTKQLILPSSSNDINKRKAVAMKHIKLAVSSSNSNDVIFSRYIKPTYNYVVDRPAGDACGDRLQRDILSFRTNYKQPISPNNPDNEIFVVFLCYEIPFKHFGSQLISTRAIVPKR